MYCTSGKHVRVGLRYTQVPLTLLQIFSLLCSEHADTHATHSHSIKNAHLFLRFVPYTHLAEMRVSSVRDTPALTPPSHYRVTETGRSLSRMPASPLRSSIYILKSEVALMC